MSKQIPFGFIIGILLTALIGGIIGGGATVKLLSPENQEAAEKVVEKQVYIENSQIIDTIKKISPSVVSIVITKDLPAYRQRIFNSPSPDSQNLGGSKYQTVEIGGGSGFIITADGLVVTNKHVVDDSSASYTIILNDGTEYSTEIISLDESNDIAVLQIIDENEPVDGLPVAKLGNSDKIQIGQQVVAVGSSLNEYENTVTTGVISAKGRSITAGSVYPITSLTNLIQTDAAITLGNSGGPLVNLNGEVIGINTALDTENESISFAIPINDALSIIEGGAQERT
ncbi:trypsin-like peptidase domain-containing protein [Patescibacteria group bacterium]|nr:trypsin-like peptidase domain-containing protein [Patescibacteria group bacterium]